MAKAPKVTRKGDVIELDGGAYRLERVVIRDEGPAVDDPNPTYKLYERVDATDDTETSYTYRYEPVGDAFDADDDDAAINEAASLMAKG